MHQDEKIERLFAREKQKQELLIKVISYVPAGSLWGIQGLYEDETILSWQLFFSEKGKHNITHESIFPDYYIEISENNRNALKELVLDTNIVNDIAEHQFFYNKEHFYLTSFDCMASNTLEKGILPEKVEKELEDKGIVEIRP